MEKDKAIGAGTGNGGLRRARPATAADLCSDTRAAALVEAAFTLPVIIMLLVGIVTYGSWFMAAHSLQQAANDAARSALAGLDADERQQLVDESIDKSVLNSGTLNPHLVTVTTSQNASYYSVSLSYAAKQSGMFSTSLVPLPANTIQRTAVVRLSSP